MRQSLFKKFFSFSYGSWIGLAIGFLTTVISTRILLPEDFGKASIFTIVMNIGTVIILCGTDQAFIRFFYEVEKEKRNILLYNCIKFPIIILAIICLLILVFNKEISLLLFETDNFLVSLMLVVGIVSQVLYNYGISVVRMQQKGNLFSNLEILNRTLNFVLLFLFFWMFKKGFEILVLSTVLALFIVVSIAIICERDYWSFRNYSRSDEKHASVDIMKFGSPLMLTMLISWLFQSFDKIALKEWSTFEEVGLYSAAIKIIALLNILQNTFTVFWTPVCYEKFEENPNDKTFYERMSKIVAFVMFATAVVIILGKDIIIYILGSDYREAAKMIPFLVFMPIMYTISETTVIGIGFYKKNIWHVFIASISCFVTVIGNWLLVPHYGALGASIATAIAYIMFFVLRTQISLKYYPVDYGLKKIYMMIVMIAAYAFYSISNISICMNIIVGCGVLFFLLIMYRSDVFFMYRKLARSTKFLK